MSTAPKFRRVGTMTYEVIVSDRVAGLVWRTRYGWSGKTADGRLVVDNYPGSRGVAANRVIAERSTT